MTQAATAVAGMPLDKIRLLALQLKKKNAGAVEIPRLPRDTNRFLPSVSQERFWLQSRLFPAGNAYNYSCAVRLSLELRMELIQGALDDLYRRHESMRTVFAVDRGMPVQVVEPFVSRPIEVVDLRLLPREQREEEARRLAAEQSERPFDLEKGPLMRTLLVRLEERQTLFVVTVHHAVCDGWCLDVLANEFATTYAALLRGLPPPFAERPIQYVDYAAWQRQQLTGPAYESLASFWRENLDGLEPLRFPLDRPRGTHQTFRAGAVTLQAGAATAAGVNELARATGATPFMVTFAAFVALLHRYAGQDDIAVGTPFGARSRKELEGVVGDFTNLLVLRADCSGDPTFRELLARVRERCLAAFGHANMPYEKLVELLHPERDASRNPFVQIAFQLESSAGMSAFGSDLASMPIAPFALPTRVTRFDVEMHLWNGLGGFLKRGASLPEGESPDGLFGNVLYNETLFERSTIERFTRHYATLLGAAVQAPDTRLSALRILSADDEALLARWSQGPRTSDTPELVHHRVAEQARRTPDAIAVRDGAASLTYAELDARAGSLARMLRLGGWGREVIVGVAMERSIERIIAVLAVWKAGAAYVPLDVSLPPERLALMIEETGAPVILADPAAVLPPLNAKVVRTSEWPDAGEDACGPAGGDAGAPSDLAYVIYTSGSTGVPKGVLTEHGALANLIAWHVRAFDVTSSDRATHLASFSFDGSIWEIWPYLAAGATVDLVPEDALGSAGRLQSWLANAGTTISFLPTALCVPLLPALEEGAPGALRMLLTGGDRLPRGPREGAPFQLVNNYGPTENGVVATWCAVPPGPAAPPIGRPVDNTEVQVLDARGQLVPPGVAGELYLGGNSLARGYLHRPELDAERFVVRNGRRFYRTGDMVRWSHDGQVEFLGRADTQVKVRCFRVELGEIEAAIASISGVRECVVDVRGEEHEKRIVAWLSGSVDGTAVRATLQQRLPEFMVPSSVIVLEAMPLTRNGKIDRKALVEHAAPAQPAAVEHIPPRTELERIIATAWQEALGVERIGIHDNFFDLGGHSLLLIRVSTILSRTLDRDLSAINLFDHTTVASLAAHLSETAPVRPAAAEPTLAAADRREAMQRQRQRRMESRA